MRLYRWGLYRYFPSCSFPLGDILSTNQVAPNYAKSIIFLFLGGFMLAVAVEKTELHKVISKRMLQVFPRSSRGMIFALAITSGFLSSCLSNTTTALLLIPMAFYLSRDPRLKVRFTLAIAYGASIGGIITPIGTPPNLILYGLLDDLEVKAIPFGQWVLLVAPLACVMFLVVGWLLSVGTDDIDVEGELLTLGPLTRDQKKVMVALAGLVVCLFGNVPIQPYYAGFGLNEKGILLFFGLLMFMPPFNILEWEDTKKIPYEIIFLFGAGFSIAMAFTSTGLADRLAQSLQHFTHFAAAGSDYSNRGVGYVCH